MTNLITAQQNRAAQQESILTAIVDSREPIVVRFDKVQLDWYTDQFGRVEGQPRGKSHRYNQNGRPCVHALNPLLRCELFGRSWVAQLGWQPCLYKNILGHDGHVIAARRDDIVTVAFDVIGPLHNCTHQPLKLEERNKFYYKLFPFRFDDQDDIFDRAWLGVWPD